MATPPARTHGERIEEIHVPDLRIHLRGGVRPAGRGDPAGTTWDKVPPNWTCPSAERARTTSRWWSSDDPMRILHTMLRVGDLPRSIDFYTNVLGMKVLRTTDRPEQHTRSPSSATATSREHAVLELTYNYGVDRYDLGTAYGHVAIEVEDAKAACEAVRAKGGTVHTGGRAGRRAARRSSRSCRTRTATRSNSIERGRAR